MAKNIEDNMREYLTDEALENLLEKASKKRKELFDREIELCGIVNAKSGACSEDCRFCAQSSHHNTKIKKYTLKSREYILKEAKKAEKNGAKLFGIVTSGDSLSQKEIGIIADTVKEIKEKTSLLPCASLGALDERSLVRLKKAGLFRYHHNIETSRRFYPQIVSSHSFDDRVVTVRNAKNAGLQVCSGGIVGMGETWDDRIDMALTLEELNVDTVPINFLVPVKGTLLEGVPKIAVADALRTIAIFRILLSKARIKIAAGREPVLGDFQNLIFKAGANGMMIGGYLTVKGRSVEDDRRLISETAEIWD